MAFVALFCRSHHSPLGVASPTLLIKRARALGLGTLGLCDEATIGGFLEFEDVCRSEGIRPIFGCRLFVDGLALGGQTFPVDFLIETEQGYRNLVRLLTAHHQMGNGSRRPLGMIDLKGRVQGLSVVIPADGELVSLIDLRDRAKTEHFLKLAIELFGANLWFGIDVIDQFAREHAPLILQLARFTGARALAAPQVRYPESGDAAAAIFLAQPGQAPGRAFKPPEDAYGLATLWPEDEVLAHWQGELEDLPHEAGNLARRCTWRPGRIRRIFPSMDLERGYDPISYLYDMVIRGATQRYGEITEPLKQRINKEIEDIRANDLAPYLLLNHQIAHALDERGLSRGVGRGRLVASVLAYCLGISRTDPLQYNLMPKSLMIEGETLPAVNVEVPRGAVPVLLAWLRETYGEDHLAEIGRIQETRREHLLNDLANWAGMTNEERRLAHREKSRARTAGAAQRLGELTEGQKSRRWRDPQFIGDLAARLAPRPRHWSATGDRYVLSGEPLEAVVPRLPSHQGRPVTGLEEEAIDRLGLARIVFVPHGVLDILDQAMRAARTMNPALDFDLIPLDDRATFELIARGDTAGIPPLESMTLRCLLRKHQPTNLLQLLRVKTEADNAIARARPGERQREVSDELPDVLLSYQCAWLKANYPLAFHSAAIGAVIESRDNPTPLIRAARRARFRVLPPDINLSDWGSTIHAGQIRLGLAAVKGFGPRAWDNVQTVRSGGNFTTLEGFCERIDARLITLKTLRALIAIGAMDELGNNRASMDAMVTLLQKRTRERAGDEDEAQPSLFDMEDLTEPEESAVAPPPEKIEIAEWNAFERQARETEALGFPLNEDPVDRFRIVRDHLRPLHVEEIPARPGNRQLRVAGLVCATENAGPLLELADDLLIDIEGLPVLLPGNIGRVSEKCLAPGTEVMVIGAIQREHGFPYLKAEGIWRLADLEDQATQVALVRLHLAGENRQTLKLLIELAKLYPGNTKLQLINYPGRMGWTYGRLARRSVFFCSPLYQGLCKILPPESIELYGQNGELLLVKSSRPKNEDGEEAEDLGT